MCFNIYCECSFCPACDKWLAVIGTGILLSAHQNVPSVYTDEYLLCTKFTVLCTVLLPTNTIAHVKLIIEVAYQSHMSEANICAPYGAFWGARVKIIQDKIYIPLCYEDGTSLMLRLKFNSQRVIEQTSETHCSRTALFIYLGKLFAVIWFISVLYVGVLITKECLQVVITKELWHCGMPSLQQKQGCFK